MGWHNNNKIRNCLQRKSSLISHFVDFNPECFERENECFSKSMPVVSLANVDVNKRSVSFTDALVSIAEAHYVSKRLQMYGHILLCMPVSSASAERYFSIMRRLKTYLRSMMSSERLS